MTLYFLKKLFLFIYLFWLCWVFAVGFSPVVVSRVYSLVVQGLLIVVSSLVAEHGL